MKVLLQYRYCFGAYCEQCDADFEALDLLWESEGRLGQWQPRAQDGGYDHHFDGGDVFSMQVQLEYLFKEFGVDATVELLPNSKNPYSEGRLRVRAPSGIVYEQELPPLPSRGPTDVHAAILIRALAFVGVEAGVVLLPDRDFSIDDDAA